MITDLTRRFEVAGFSLAWDEWGRGPGPPLVLLHGFSGSSHDFALQIEPLARDRRVLAIDHRGHGRSSNSHDEATYTIDHMVDDVIDWIDHAVDHGPVDLLGHSMGGRVALCVALARRDLLRSLILMDTTAWAFGSDDPELTGPVVDYFSSLGPDSTLAPDPPHPEDDLIEAATSAAFRSVKDDMRTAFDPMAAKALGTAVFGNHLQPVDHLLGDIDMPVTVIVGEHDHPYVDHAPDLAAGVVHGECVVIAGAHHSPQLTHPEEWRAAVLGHLARVG